MSEWAHTEPLCCPAVCVGLTEGATDQLRPLENECLFSWQHSMHDGSFQSVSDIL